MKPSELIRSALADLEKVEAMPDTYEVNMDWWHDPHIVEGKCFVCLAGARMAMTLGADPIEEVDPTEVEDEIERRRLMALDWFRMGRVLTGLDELDIDPPDGMPHRWPVTKYEAGCRKFHADMRALAAMLEEHGL